MSTDTKKRTLYVTDQGSVKLGNRMLMPGQEVDAGAFRGREAALRELIQQGRLARRPGSYMTTPDGVVVKLRSAEAPPLPSELDEYDPKTKRELRPLRSETPHAHDIHQQLAELKREQKARAAAKEAERLEPDRAIESEQQEVEAPVDVDDVLAEFPDQGERAGEESDEDFFDGLLVDAGDDLEVDVDEED